MITASIPQSRLLRRLVLRAALLGRMHGDAVASDRRSNRVNWHSARSLWPESQWD